MIKAKYTIVLDTLLNDPESKTLIDKAMSTYPMYQPKNEFEFTVIPTREELNKKILNYYRFREIGQETFGRFLFELETSLNEIMPYYNGLYKSVDIMNDVEDIFGNVNVTETYQETSQGNSTSNVSSNSNTEGTSNVNTYNKNVTSNTPQNELHTTPQDINNVLYADRVDWSSSNGDNNDTSSSETESTSTGTTTGTTSHTMTKKGNQGVNTYAHDLLEFRELFINIEQMIINDKRIAELFMMVY